MSTKDVKQMIIENYIDWYASDEAEREALKNDAAVYVQEDHVDEIAQAYPELADEIDENVPDVYYIFDGSRRPYIGQAPDEREAARVILLDAGFKIDTLPPDPFAFLIENCDEAPYDKYEFLHASDYRFHQGTLPPDKDPEKSIEAFVNAILEKRGVSISSMDFLRNIIGLTGNDTDEVLTRIALMKEDI